MRRPSRGAGLPRSLVGMTGFEPATSTSRMEPSSLHFAMFSVFYEVFLSQDSTGLS
jgi:hypothetical protein